MTFLIWTILFGFFQLSKGTIHFYENTNFEGEFYQIQFVPYGIHDIGEGNFAPPQSIKTSECVVLLGDETGPNDINVVIEPSGISEINEIFPGHFPLDHFVPKKFALCEDFFGPKYSSRGVIVTFNADPPVNISLAEVKGCFTFPSIGEVQRIYNFGNCIKIYESDDCKESSNAFSDEIRGGTSEASMQPDLNITPKSLSHCHVRCPSCIRLNATLQKIWLFEDHNEYSNLTETVDLGLKTRVVNTGPVEVVQEYVSTVDIQHVIELPLDPFLTEMNSVTISPSVQMFANNNMTFIFGFLKATLAKAYKNRQIVNNHETTFKNHMTKTVTDTKQFTFKACTIQSFQSAARVVQNFPVHFVMHYSITISDEHNGDYDAEFIKNNLIDWRYNIDSLEYLEQIDDRTVMASLTGTMYVTYGKEMVILGEGLNIHYCPNTQNVLYFP